MDNRLDILSRELLALHSRVERAIARLVIERRRIESALAALGVARPARRYGAPRPDTLTQQILDALASSERPMSSRDVAAAIAMDPRTVQKNLSRLRERGLVSHRGDRTWQARAR